MLNGQMLIVGNWDAVAERITGNQAGNVCTSWRDGECHDAARVSDAFLMAPGVNIVSTYPGSGYAAMTGTSMAAPLVAAAAAVLHQTWPHLNGRQLASLLLETANRDIPGYAEHVHGKGLLDMERATCPVGDSGVPTGDTVASQKLALEGGGALADPGAAARAGAAVVYEGYIVGAVAHVTPESGGSGMRFRVNLDVERDWVIPADSFAEISAVSLLSTNAIQISAGTGTPLAPGSEIKSVTAVNVTAEISKSADELTAIAQTHLAPLLGTLREVLDVAGRDTLSSMSELSGALATQIPQIMINIETATANMADMTSRENVDSIRRTIGNVEQVSQEVVDIAGNAAEVTSGVVRVASGDNIARVGTILDRLDRAAIKLESTMPAANRATERMETAMSEANMQMVGEFLSNLRVLKGDISRIVGTGLETSQNVQIISEIGEDRLTGFLRRMEAAALNIEEMTARLRDDPSLIIRGSDQGRLKP